MSGKGDTPKNGGQEGILESVKQAGQSVSSAISNKAGGSQVSLSQTLPGTGVYLPALVDAQFSPGWGCCARERVRQQQESGQGVKAQS